MQLLLRPIYAQLALAMPDDPNPRRYVGLIDDGSVERTARAGRAIVTAIEANAARIAATRPQENAPGPTPAEIVASPEWRLWAAAKLALDLPPDLQATSCLLAVSLTGSERELVAGHPLARPVCQRVIERPADEQPAAAGNATAEHDEQHRLDRLLAWAALASLVGGAEAEAAALVATGIANSQATSVDLEAYADCCAGICLAARLGPGRSQLTVARIAEEKGAARLLPQLGGELKTAASQISRDQFERLYGSATDERFAALRTTLCEQIAAKPSLR